MSASVTLAIFRVETPLTYAVVIASSTSSVRRWVLAEDFGRRAVVPTPRNRDVHVAHRRDELAHVRAVSRVAPSFGPLVPGGADHRLQLLLEEGLERDSDRAEGTVAQIDLDVFLRWGTQ